MRLNFFLFFLFLFNFLRNRVDYFLAILQLQIFMNLVSLFWVILWMIFQIFLGLFFQRFLIENFSSFLCYFIGLFSMIVSILVYQYFFISPFLRLELFIFWIWFIARIFFLDAKILIILVFWFDGQSGLTLLPELFTDLHFAGLHFFFKIEQFLLILARYFDLKIKKSARFGRNWAR